MKAGVVTSVIAHTLVLSWGLMTLSNPEPLKVADVSALSVDVIPYEQLTGIIEGAKKAPLADRPAPMPTTRPKEVKKAVHVGDTKADTKSTPAAKLAAKPVDAVAPPKSAPEPKAKPKNITKSRPKESLKQVPAPTTKVAAEPEPRVKVAAITPKEQVEVTKQSEPLPQEEFLKLPDLVPVPSARPVVAPANTAKTNERKEAVKPATQVARAAPQTKSKKDADKIAALLNRQEPTASGAKRSQKRASLGTKSSNGAKKLSQGQMDALRGKIQGCFNLTAGMADAEELRATVTVKLNRAGELEGKPEVTASGGSTSVRRAFRGAARRAVQKCAPYDELPRDKYETWADLVVNFDVSDML